MLSAVAARRAAQAQAQAAQPSAADNHTAQPGISSAKTFVSAKPPSKKRKPSASAGPPPSRTLKKQKAKANVVFETPIASTPFRSRASPPTNSEDDERAWSDAEEWTGAQSEVEDALPTALVQGQRTWSPSRPLVDSSDEEEIAAGPSTHRSVPVRGAPPETKVLSTFVPQLNVNTFTLSPSEQDSLFPPSASEAKSRAAVALIVREEETLCLLGMYTLSILRGRVTISGATLAASSIEHRVFAPRSSPLPVIHHVPFSPERLVQPRIPDRIHDRLGAGDALVVLRELRTGVEALGDICPPFSGVFRRSARDAEPAHDLGIPGVQLVGRHAVVSSQC
jgi:polynucleotide 5'-hydroxyl-kinase GRC3/NOL9